MSQTATKTTVRHVSQANTLTDRPGYLPVRLIKISDERSPVTLSFRISSGVVRQDASKADLRLRWDQKSHCLFVKA